MKPHLSVAGDNVSRAGQKDDEDPRLGLNPAGKRGRRYATRAGTNAIVTQQHVARSILLRTLPAQEGTSNAICTRSRDAATAAREASSKQAHPQWLPYAVCVHAGSDVLHKVPHQLRRDASRVLHNLCIPEARTDTKHSIGHADVGIPLHGSKPVQQ